MTVTYLVHLVVAQKQVVRFSEGCRWLVAGLILFISTKGMAQLPTTLPEPSPGIQFFEGSWADVLAEAKRQNKPVFIDIYTTWCPPCQRMAREAFPNAAVGAKFNRYFLNYQVNAEAGEGLLIVKRYNVASYPTALFIIPSGELVHRGVGYGGIKALLEQADMIYAMPQVRRSRRKRQITHDLVDPSETAKPQRH